MIILVFDTACCGSTHAGIGVGFPIIPNTPRHAVALHVWGVDGGNMIILKSPQHAVALH
ncbi:hypothetical protein DSECCO2_562890 [anaerobic digester metagenome]